MALTDLKLRAAQPAAKPYPISDGHGLFILVQQNGPKLWRWKWRFQGEYRQMAFGSYPLVSLSDARAVHAVARADSFVHLTGRILESIFAIMHLQPPLCLTHGCQALSLLHLLLF
jgi:hypothetical protein